LVTLIAAKASPFFLVKKGPKRQAEKILPRSRPLPMARVFRQAFALFLITLHPRLFTASGRCCTAQAHLRIAFSPEAALLTGSVHRYPISLWSVLSPHQWVSWQDVRVSQIYMTQVKRMKRFFL
jgi:hypothetical protein